MERLLKEKPGEKRPRRVTVGKPSRGGGGTGKGGNKMGSKIDSKV